MEEVHAPSEAPAAEGTSGRKIAVPLKQALALW